MKVRYLLSCIAFLVFLAACSPSQSSNPSVGPTETGAKSTAATDVATATAGAKQELTLATTTSTADTGLLEAILPAFERANNVKVKVIAVGTGQAIQIGERGDADVLLVHARDKEDKFMADGHGDLRKDVMYNDFVILGPEADPAGVKGTKDVVEAFTKIASSKATFVSRGDESGTHTKEKEVWSKAGLKPAPDDKWYLSSGQGMGGTITMAEEKLGYTISDRGTYLAWKDKTRLAVVVEGDAALFNPYGVIAVSTAKHPTVKHDLALKFIEYVTSLETQKAIGEYGKEKYGQNLFFPDSQEWKAARRS